MNLGKIVSGVRKVLGKLTDILLIGRQQGWWSQKNQLPKRRK